MEQKTHHLIESILGSNILSSLVIAAILGIASGLGWVVRRVFTNQKQVELLRQSIHDRDEQRKEDREDILEVKSDVKDLSTTVITFIAKQEVRDEQSK